MIRVLLHMSSNSVNERCIPIFVSKSPKITNQELVEEENCVTLAAVEEEVFPLTTSPQQGYSSFQYNNDPIDDTNNTLTCSIITESYHSPIDDEDDDLFNACIDNGNDGHLNNTYDDEDGVHDEGLVNNKEELPDFQNEQQLP